VLSGTYIAIVSRFVNCTSVSCRTRVPNAHAHHPTRAGCDIDLLNQRHLLNELRSFFIAIGPFLERPSLGRREI
jgi:hypothetical protein